LDKKRGLLNFILMVVFGLMAASASKYMPPALKFSFDVEPMPGCGNFE